jgi:hypothetical protein
MQEYETQSINWNFHYYECEQHYSVQYQVLTPQARIAVLWRCWIRLPQQV